MRPPELFVMTFPVDPEGRKHWTFLSNHAHVLVCLHRDSRARLKDVADLVGLTERAVQRIVAELEEAGVLTRRRQGRRNSYVIHTDLPLRHPLEADRSVGSLLEMVNRRGDIAAPQVSFSSATLESSETSPDAHG